MLPTAQTVAIDLTSNKLQASDSNPNNSSSNELGGSFSALLQSQPPGGGQSASGQSGSGLPATGSELPAEQPGVPGSEPITDFVAYFADDETMSGLATEDGLLAAGEESPGPAIIPGLTGLAPAHSVESSPVSLARRDVRAANRTNLGNDGGSSFFHRDHGRMPFAQPMSAPDRTVFNMAGQAVEQMATVEAADLAVGRELTSNSGDTGIPDRKNLGIRLPGLAATDQGTRVSADAMGSFELPVPRDGAEATVKPATPLQTAAMSALNAELPQIRDLAGATKPTPLFATTIENPVMDESWGEAFQDRILWMAKGRIQNAEIRLNPAELGPIRVQVSVEDDAAMLQFTAQHGATREAIEQALPRLREMLSENGLTLADSSVNDSSDGQAEDRDNASEAEAGNNSDVSTAANKQTESASNRRVDSSSLVDTFA